MKPSSLNDLAALTALYRLGSIQQIKLHSDINTVRAKPHTKIHMCVLDAHGIIAHQEQVMLMAQSLSGYSPVEADELRTAMAKEGRKKGKKKDNPTTHHHQSETLAHTKRLIDGTAANGVNKRLAAQVFETLIRFADYGFTRAVAYATLAYATACSKRNFALEFYAISLTVETNEANEITDSYYEVEFAQPSVRMPYNKFKIINSVIQFPLSAVKTCRNQRLSSVAAFETNKPFTSLTESACVCVCFAANATQN